jgi:predicted secreted protein
MVHRPADSRLLSNLLQQEKEYSKQLSQLLESSNASLASFTAYAAASPPPGSHVIMSVAGSLAGIDEALKRYAQGVDEWRETMRSLKDAEEEVGNIMRDREILCVVFSFFFFVSYIYIPELLG